MTYAEELVAPVREELTALGFEELRTPDAVDRFMAESRDDVAMLVVNSVCDCARCTMRPALAMALGQPARPARLGTVFAGSDGEATNRARDYFKGYAPSSPAIALFRKGEIFLMVQRPRIKGHHPSLLAEELTAAFRRALGVEVTA